MSFADHLFPTLFKPRRNKIQPVKTESELWREKIREEIVKTLATLEQPLAYKASKAKRALRECSFEYREDVVVEGECTRYGACRWDGLDYMYQGGCTRQAGQQVCRSGLQGNDS